MILALSLLVVATSPCSRQIDAYAPMVVPADGATGVPTNATPIVSGTFSAELPELVIGGVPVPARIEPFESRDGFGVNAWLRIIPDAALPAVATVDVAFGGERAAGFATGVAEDLEAPPAPTVAFVGPFADGACVPYVEVSVESDLASIARIGDAPSLAEGSEVHGLGTDGFVIVAGEADAQERVFVSTVDLAGHVSEPASVDVTFPPELKFPGGCSAFHQGSAPTLALAVLLLALRRRSRAAS